MKIRKQKCRKVLRPNLFDTYFLENLRVLKNFSCNFKSEVFQLKKICDIIYRYHVRGYKILFVGVSPILLTSFRSLQKDVPHAFIPSNVWVNGALTSTRARLCTFVQQNKQNNLNFFFHIKKSPKLIVLVGSKKNDQIVKESTSTGVPAILLGLLDQSSYKTETLYTKVEPNLLQKEGVFFAVLKKILKKPKNVTRAFIKKSK